MGTSSSETANGKVTLTRQYKGLLTSRITIRFVFTCVVAICVSERFCIVYTRVLNSLMMAIYYGKMLHCNYMFSVQYKSYIA